MTSTPDPIYHRLFGDRVSKGNRKKLEIIEAAIQVVATQGLPALTYEAIAIRLKTNRAHIAYHFPEIEPLLCSALQYVTETAQFITVERVRAETHPARQILAIAEGSFEWAARYPEQLSAMMCVFHLSGHRPQIERMHAEIRASGLERLCTLVGNWEKASGVLLPGPADSIGSLIQTLITGAMVSLATAPDTSKHLIPETLGAISLWLGYRGGKPP